MDVDVFILYIIKVQYNYVQVWISFLLGVNLDA